MNNLIIGIAGGSGSGKTTLACRLKALFGEDEVRLISHDSYYKRHDELPRGYGIILLAACFDSQLRTISEPNGITTCARSSGG